MSVTKVVRSPSATRACIYVAYGTHQNLQNGDVRAARLSVACGREGTYSVLDAAMAMRQDAVRHKRSVQAIVIIQAWSPDELSIDDPADIEKAHTAGLLLAEQLAPGADVVVGTHIDSNGGHVHNHIVIGNHDRLTGKSVTGKGADFHPAVKAANDEIMRALGMDVLEPQAEAVPWAERGDLTDSNWREVMRGQIALLVADERVAGAASVDDALDAMQEFAGDYKLSFGRRGAGGQRKTNNASSFALLDDDGEVMKVPSKGKTVECKSRGSKLGKEYTVKGLREVLERAMQEHQRQQVINQEIAALEAALSAEEEANNYDLARASENGSEARFSTDSGRSEGSEQQDSGLGGAGQDSGRDDQDIAGTSGFSDVEIQRAVERLRGEVEGLGEGVNDLVSQRERDQQERERDQREAQRWEDAERKRRERQNRQAAYAQSIGLGSSGTASAEDEVQR